MFVEIEGFNENGITLPHHLTPTTDGRIILTLIRWLSPHPRAILRDKSLRPICPPPLDINHALWKFTETGLPRPLLTDVAITRNLNHYHGNDIVERKRAALLESRAFYDLIVPESIDYFMNCTRCDQETEDHNILETITIPFE